MYHCRTSGSKEVVGAPKLVVGDVVPNTFLFIATKLLLTMISNMILSSIMSARWKCQLQPQPCSENVVPIDIKRCSKSSSHKRN